ncbi:MAG: glycosyltransferase family 4 protein [Nitrospirae bacterium]|nr:glycosyltransferase family 4 protein [Nitrospirota bacterium]
MTTLSILQEYRFTQTPDGAVWTQTTYTRPFWNTYLEVFSSINIIARLKKVERLVGDWARVDDEQVVFYPLPYYVGSWHWLRVLPSLAFAMHRAVPNDNALLLRLPSPLAVVLMRVLRPKDRPYGVQVIGDPNDVFAPGVVSHPLRSVWRQILTEEAKRQCFKACAVSYVTREFLRRQYPSSPSAFSTYYSDSDLHDNDYVELPRNPDHITKAFSLLTVGSLDQLYKGTDLLIESLGICVHGGWNLALTVIGEGRYREYLEEKAKRAGIYERVHFLRYIPYGPLLHAEYDQADLFVLPSRTEGLPRVLIEAMARGLPCIASAVGGIPELLDPDDLIVSNNKTALVNKIKEVLSHPDRLRNMSLRNLRMARNYHADILRGRRLEFYSALRDRTKEWLLKRL